MADIKKKPNARQIDGMNKIVYDSVLWIFDVILDLFFREIHPRSSWRIPRKGPVLFVAAPHANQFIDPLILMRLIRREARRRVAFLIAEKSMKRRLIGTGARMMGAVPVGRALDATKNVPGKIYLPDPENDPQLVRGIGTNFESSEFQIGGLLVLPTVRNTAANAEIVEVVGPEEIRVKKPFGGSTALNQLTGRERVIPDGKTEDDIPTEFNGTPFKVAPKIDQSGVYTSVFQTLERGGCVGIFPEGGSHDRPDLLPFKAGIAIMALQTMVEHPDCGLTIVPCGMNYFHAHKFRSRAVVEFGAPLEVNPEYVEIYKSGDRRTAISKLLDDVHKSVVGVTVNAPDYETLMLVQAVRRLYNPKHKRLPLPSVVELNRRLIKGYEKFKQDERVARLRENVMGYNQSLLQLQIRDHQVENANLPYVKILGLLLYRLSKLVLLLIAVLPGLALFLPVFVAGKLISIKKSKEALAASSVKIHARDVMATWKLMVSLVLAPTLYVFYDIILGFLTYQNRLFGIVPTWAPLWLVLVLGFIVFIMITYAALRFGEVGMDIIKSLRPLFVALSPHHGHTIQKLQSRREHLAADVTDLINELGPEMFPDFRKQRIIKEDELDYPLAEFDGDISEPPTPTTPGTPGLSSFGSHHIPRNESLHDFANIGVFASRPTTPYHARSRSRTNSGYGFTALGFSPISEKKNVEELSQKIRGEMRQRTARRKSQSGEWDSDSSGADGAFDGLTMTKKNT